MTAPVFILTPADLSPAGALPSAAAGDLVVLGGYEARHAVTVRRLKAGERADLVDGRGLRLVCEVVSADSRGREHHLTARVLERVEEPEPQLHLVLVQALAKGGRDEQAVEMATEVGADAVIPWQGERCVSVWKGDRAAKGRKRWQARAREAAKQARRARVPVVHEALGTRALCGWVARVADGAGAVLLAHEEADTPIGSVALPRRGALAVLVGPEGGVSAEETAALERAGATTVRLGPHVMRTSSAGPVALAVLAQRAGMWAGA